MDANFNFLFQYLKKEKIHIDQIEFEFQIKSHPEYPSLLSISDTLTFFGILNQAIKVDVNDISLLPVNFIALLKNKDNQDNLSFIEKKENEYLIYNNDTKSIQDIIEFTKSWSNVVLLIDIENKAINYIKNNNYKSIYLVLALSIILFFSLNISLFDLSFLIFPITGVLLSIFALKDLFEVKNQFISNICNITLSSDCETVLKSEKWKLFKFINFSDLSIVFFLSQIIYFIFSLFEKNIEPFMIVQKMILFFSLPLLIVSIYYQKFIEKKWCPICLSIATLIIFEFFYFINYESIFLFKEILFFSFIFITIHSLWLWIKSILIKQKELKENQLKSNRFQRNYTNFKNNLLVSNKISSLNTPIILGNKNSKTIITIITSPFCGHCKEVHDIINEILVLNQSKIQVHLVIKTDFEIENENKKDFFRSLLNIYFEKGENEFIDKLDDWFINKKLEDWLRKNKSNGNSLSNFDLVFINLNKWCSDNNYNFTPAIFINGYEYPNSYERKSLEFFIKDIIEDEF